MFICQKSLKFTKSEEKSVVWAKKVTDLHEKMAKGEKLDTAMDLHNNEIGRKHFLEVFNQNEEKTIDFIQKSLQNSKIVSHIDEIEIYRNELVYISE